MLAALSLATVVVVAALLSVKQPNTIPRFRYQLEIYWQSWQREMCNEEREEKGHAMWLYSRLFESPEKSQYTYSGEKIDASFALGLPRTHPQCLKKSLIRFKQTQRSQHLAGSHEWVACPAHNLVTTTNTEKSIAKEKWSINIISTSIWRLRF